MKPLLIGEVNPYGADPRAALFPLPRGAAGDRLRRVFGLTDTEYLTAFDRVNLCTSRWSLRAARAAAERIRWAGEPRARVLLGAKVCEAFEVKFTPFAHWTSPYGQVVVLPHPSGRCRIWNEPGAFERARGVLHATGVL